MRLQNHGPHPRDEHPGLLRRLARDQRGNALLIMTAAIVPIAGMIGSGLDMSRAYMAKAKLQTACDATALATRRFMASSQVSEEARAEGRKFFAFNFPAGTMDTTPVVLTIEPAAEDLSMVEVSATTEIPTTIMAIFGTESIALEAECSADQDFVNNDIMLVLDVTLSMNCEAGKVGSYCTTEKSGGLSRVARVRAAGVALYDALAGAAGMRTRYGFMPYSMTVNLGDTLPSAYRRNPARYRDAGQSMASKSHTAADFVTYSCIEERSSIAENQDPAQFKIGEAVATADIDLVSTSDEKLKWQSYDHDAQKMKNSGGLHASLASFCPNKATRLASYDSKAGFQTAFNAAMQKVGGYTFHDIGMMWAMRYLSSNGMFAADNPVELPNPLGPPIRVDKHIVFLTDGELIVNDQTYSAYGVDKYDKRMTGSQTGQEAKHKAHFLSACNRARQMGMTVWVIAIDVGASSDIKPCASGDDHFFESNGKDLDKVFSLIGKGIGRLRITK